MKTLKPEEKEKLQAMLDQHSTNYTETSNSISGVSTDRRFVNFIIDIYILGYHNSGIDSLW